MGKPTIAMLVSLVGLVGFVLGTGMWAGDLQRLVVEHDRRLDRQDMHMAAIDRTAAETSARLSAIEASLSFLVRQAHAETGTVP